jgi:hypothetical protein
MKNSQAFLFGTVVIILFSISDLFAQIPKDSISGQYAYQGLVKVDSATKQQLYTNAKNWILKTLKSVDNMVELDDKEFNAITGSGTILLDKQNSGPYSYQNGKLNFKLLVQFKDGRLKYTFQNFTYWGEVYMFMQTTALKTVNSSLEELELPGKGKNNVIENVNEKMKSLVNSFASDVSKAGSVKKDDW